MEGVADMIIRWVWLSGRCGRYDCQVDVVEWKVWQV